MSSHELTIKTFCDMPNQFFISINHYFSKYDITLDIFIFPILLVLIYLISAIQ